MSTQLQLRRGTTSQIGAMTPAAGELLYDMTFKSLFVGDGSTVGGYRLPYFDYSGDNEKFTVNEPPGSNGTARFNHSSSDQACLLLVNSATTGDNHLANLYTDATILRGSISYNRSGGVVSFNTTSDQRLKEVIEGDFDFGGVIDSVQPHHYRRTDVTAENFGFFAQELHAAVPTAVTVGSDGDAQPGQPGFIPWQVDTSQLVPYLWAEIRSLRARVAALEAATAPS